MDAARLPGDPPPTVSHAIELGATDVEPLSDAEWQACVARTTAAKGTGARSFLAPAATFVGTLTLGVVLAGLGLQRLDRPLRSAPHQSSAAAGRLDARTTTPVVATPGELDALTYQTLQQQVALLLRLEGRQDAQEEALRWGQYRLAKTFADHRAENQLAVWGAAVARQSPPPLAAAVAAAQGAQPVPDPHSSPQAAYLSANSLAARQPSDAMALAAWALHRAPQLVEAQLLRQRMLLRRSQGNRALNGLAALCVRHPAIVGVHAAPLLLQAGAYDPLERCLEALRGPQALAAAAPAQRDAAYGWAMRGELAQGSLAPAVALGQQRLRGANAGVGVSPAAFADLARLHAWRGSLPKAQGVLNQGMQVAASPAARAELAYRALQQALIQQDAAATQRALDYTNGVPGKQTAGWLPLLLGHHAYSQNKARTARYYLRRARRAGRLEAAALLAELEASPPEAPRRATAGRGRAAARLAAKEKVATSAKTRSAEDLRAALFVDPYSSDPQQLFAAWLGALLASGDGAKALAHAERALRRSDGDGRALQTWLQIARPQVPAAELARRLESLQRDFPRRAAVTVALAGAYVAAEQPLKAIAVGETLVGEERGAYHPELLYVLGRAYRHRDDRRAAGYLQRAAVAQPRASVYYELARLAADQQNRRGAQRALQQALRLEPDHAPSQALQAALRVD